MREGFEEAALSLQQLLQLLGPVAVQAAEEREVVGPGQDIDGVHLHKAQALHQGLNGCRGGPPGGIRQQPLGPQEHTPGGGGGDGGQRVGHGPTLTYSLNLCTSPRSRSEIWDSSSAVWLISVTVAAS